MECLANQATGLSISGSDELRVKIILFFQETCGSRDLTWPHYRFSAHANKRASQVFDVPEIDGFGVMADHLDVVVDVATGVLDPRDTTHLRKSRG